MIYKVGDKVRIKTWEEVKDIVAYFGVMERELVGLNSGRVLTIDIVNKLSKTVSYKVVETSWTYDNNMIECLVNHYVKPELKKRWEILDLRG